MRTWWRCSSRRQNAFVFGTTRQQPRPQPTDADKGALHGVAVPVRWLDTAGTGLFLVYNVTQHVDPFDRTGILAGPRKRQFVIKYSRLLGFTR